MKRTTTILAIAVLTVTAGCIGGAGGGNGDGQPTGPPPVDHVPDGVHSVASYDAAVVSDPATKSVLDTYLQETIPEESDSPRTVDGIFEEFENQTADATNLSMSSISGAVVFQKFPSMGSMMVGGQPDFYGGALVRSGWTESELVGTIRANLSEDSGVRLNETNYGGTTLYVLEETETGDPGMGTPGMAGMGLEIAFAKYDDDLWAFGTRGAVEDVIDVSNGDGEALSGDLREVYDSTRSDAYVRTAVEIPEEYSTALERAAEGGMGPGPGMGGGVSKLPVGNVTHLSMSYYTEGGQDGSIGMNLNVRFDDEDPAESVKDQAEGAISVLEGRTENETLKTQIEAINVSREGRTVSMNYESAVSDVETMIEQFANAPALPGPGMGGGPPATPPPQVAFDYEWDSQNGRLTVVHEGGDTVDGENLRAVCGGTVLDVPADRIQAGVTVVDTERCSAGDTVRIVWQSPSEGTTQVLSTFEIPGSARLAGPTLAGGP